MEFVRVDKEFVATVTVSAAAAAAVSQCPRGSVTLQGPTRSHVYDVRGHFKQIEKRGRARRFI